MRRFCLVYYPICIYVDMYVYVLDDISVDISINKEFVVCSVRIYTNRHIFISKYIISHCNLYYYNYILLYCAIWYCVRYIYVYNYIYIYM